MTEQWDFQTFTDVLKSQNWSKAIKYKNSCIPSRLFKYSPLFDDRCSYNQEENKKRLTSLRENQIWVSNYRCLNDPFELNTLALNRKEVEAYGWKIDELRTYLSLLKSLIQVCCLSDYGINHLPMWAHYSNNHEGYCTEYQVVNQSSIYPVTYVPKRELVATIPTAVASELSKGIKNNKPPSERFWKYFAYLFITFSCKFEHWQYENEFRVFNVDTKVDKGKLTSLKDAGLSVSRIYIGMNCKHGKDLETIGKNLRCEVYKMTLDEYSSEFTLQPEKIL